ncbi:MAG TPA: rhomboid-like protein [Frankiaceae bacterium]|nr:rhomboid-like protein [Frankiaceae bacterium]
MSHPCVRRLWDLTLRTKTSVLSTPLAACFALGLVLVEFVMWLLPNSDETALARAASTNITHLAIDPLFVLPASAFVDLGNTWLWVPLTLILLGGLERMLGRGRALMIVFGAHVIATVISEGMLLLQIAWHAQPRSQVNILDVGPSYVILAAMAACLVLGSWKLRLAAVLSGAIVIPGLLSGITGLDMSALGHLSSLVLGTLFALAFTDRGKRWIASHRRAIPKPTLVVLRKPATA